MKERHHFIVLEKTGLLCTGFAEIADKRGRRVASRAIRIRKTGLHVEVCCVAEPVRPLVMTFEARELWTP